jgi:hypothetical protein
MVKGIANLSIFFYPKFTNYFKIKSGPVNIVSGGGCIGQHNNSTLIDLVIIFVIIGASTRPRWCIE